MRSPKKKDKEKDKDKDSREASGIEASTDYTIGIAGGGAGITDTPEGPSTTAGKVVRSQDIMNNREETMISSPSPSYDNTPAEPTVATSSFNQYQYQQNYQQQREQQQSGINRALNESRDNIRKSTDVFIRYILDKNLFHSWQL